MNIPKFNTRTRKRHLQFESLEARRVLTTVIVDIADDVDDAPADVNVQQLNAGNRGEDGMISLREALRAADANQDVDTILFDSTLLNGATITLTEGELPVAFSVTIDATARDITINASGSSRIFNIAGLGSENVEIKGLTLTGGNALLEGGAIRSQDANLTLRNTIITGSSAASGGGLYFDGNGTNLSIIDSTISNNSSGSIYGNRGGGALVVGSDSAIVISGTTFSGNTLDVGDPANPTDGGGGGLYVALTGSGSSIDISASTLTGNKALGPKMNGGGLNINANGFDVVLDRLQVLGNEADDDGGGAIISNDGGEVTLQNSTITGNIARDDDNGYDGGGGLALSTAGAGETIVKNSTIAFNEAFERSGGGIFIEASPQTTTTIMNTTISGNRAGRDGGGVMMSRNFSYEGASVNILHSTITDNRANSDMVSIGDGGGIHRASGTASVTMHNTIVSGNLVWDSAILQYTSNNIDGALVGTSSYNLVGTGGDGGLTNSIQGNIIGNDDPDLGPLMDNGGETFTHAPDSSSPALDAGDPAAVAGVNNVPLFDQRGKTRVFSVAGTPRIDIGAFELSLMNMPMLSADFDGDGDVDGFDFLIWQQNFGLKTGATKAQGDADANGTVDVTDLMIWSEEFGFNTNIDADFNNDQVIDGIDLMAWESSFGINAGGDADGDGDTDGMDFLAWQAMFGQSINRHQWAAFSIAFSQLAPGELIVTTTDDEDDGDYSLGDLSLREAIKIANANSGPRTIVLPEGRYILDRIGSELNDATNNDLDITSDVTVVGDGAGFTFIDSSALSGSDRRAFDLTTSGSRLDVSGVTLTGGSNSNSASGTAIRAKSGSELVLTDSAVVNHNSPYNSAIYVDSSIATIRRNVFTNNDGLYTSGPAVMVKTTGSNSATLTIGQSIFALNLIYNGTNTANVSVTGNVTKVNEGYNLFDKATGGFFNTTPGTGDYLGTPDYVVTSVADTFVHTDNEDALSLREAIDLSNADTTQREVWLPAWNLVLTRDRGANVTDTDVSYGDLDIKESLIIRGVMGVTSVAWTPGVVDAIFDLLGDFSGDGVSNPDDGDVDGDDYLTWLQQVGSTNGVYSADGDDDGDVDGDDFDIWAEHSGNTLDLFDISV